MPLAVCATPIGNLDDITLRVLAELAAAELVLAEDTRHTRVLLERHAIEARLLSLHAHNEAARVVELLPRLRDGARMALVSDAGMPGISDPGLVLARAAIEAGVAVYPIPGANAAVNAVIGSGLAADCFLYAGFLPARSGARRLELERLAGMIPRDQALTLVFYEAPHRILETLEDVEKVWGAPCRVVVARELTKVHEEFLRGGVSEIRQELAGRDRVRGEITLLVEARSLAGDASTTIRIKDRVAELQRAEGMEEMDALKRAARERGISKSEAYRELQRERARR